MVNFGMAILLLQHNGQQVVCYSSGHSNMLILENVEHCRGEPEQANTG